MYFVVFFVSPLYFLLRKRWGGFLINAVLYAIAMLCLASIFLAWLALIPWTLGVGHAAWHYRREVSREMMEEHASLIAAKMAEQNKIASGANNSGMSPSATATPKMPTDVARPVLMPSNSPAAPPTFCENCGAKIDASSSFCDECGEKVAS